ncbi:hypothetical protein [Neisseria iguanae]|uniref:hypothetical protein n=1 Tax=Neisseria iguanae TaxID=90242 RepID=UPI0014748586|nr:hypothetical protein [Neisseria iguanae]
MGFAWYFVKRQALKMPVSRSGLGALGFAFGDVRHVAGVLGDKTTQTTMPKRILWAGRQGADVHLILIRPRQPLRSYIVATTIPAINANPQLIISLPLHLGLITPFPHNRHTLNFADSARPLPAPAHLLRPSEYR